MNATLYFLARSTIFVLAAFAAATPVLAGDNLLAPPPNCATVRIGTCDYVKGEVYLSCHDDTTMLKEFGFRNMYFVGRSLSSVKYFAMWPVKLDVMTLPDAVSGINYDRPADEMVLDNLEKTNASPMVRTFLQAIPEPWTYWPNVSEIQGSGVRSGEWYFAGYAGADYYFCSPARYYTTRTYSVRGSCSSGRCRLSNYPNTKLRPDDFGILKGYR